MMHRIIGIFLPLLALILVDSALASPKDQDDLCKRYPDKKELCLQVLDECRQYAADDNISPSDIEAYLMSCIEESLGMSDDEETPPTIKDNDGEEDDFQ